MSVRRLASDDVQPKAFAFSRKMEPEVKRWLKKYPKGREQSAVIPLLMLAQEQEGWVSKPAIEHVGTMLGMPFIRVLEVATFYTQFQLKPVGTKAHIQVCGTTPCMLRGSEELMRVCKEKIHPEQFHVNAKGTLSWEEVECLGACVNAPMVMIFKDTYEDLTPERLAEIIDEFEAGRGEKVKPGPQIARAFSAPEGGYTTLQDKKAISKAERQRLAREHARELAVKEAAKAAETAKAAASAPEAPSAKTAEAGKAAPAKAAGGKALTARKPAKAQAAPASLASVPAKAPSKPKADAKSSSAKAAAEKAPELLKKPRSGKGDDLKLIWGVGPKLAKMLNDMGVWHFDQIAAWGKAELNWVDDRLEGFKGRASRDEWVKQSKKLAKGWRPENSTGEKP
ncbi:MAG: NADH-quinone oxidoreductase subunit E [Novosphingobium sp.]|nr:NADH-quinone oxidoreductase subunit E [Novosphingobium sp.]